MADLLARDVLDYDDRLKMAALRILAESRKPVDVRGPGEIRIPVGAPPDNWLYNTLADPKLNAGLAQLGHNLVGSGTGSISGDILAGFLGGGAGIATEAAGGESGALDWIPGGGLLKGAVIAAPKVMQTVRRVGQRAIADDAVDLLKDVAQSVVNRLARVNDHIVTPDEIKQAVIEEVGSLGDFNGASLMKEYATDMATDVLNRARTAQLNGNLPDLSVRVPDKVNFSSRALEDIYQENNEAILAAKRQFTADMADAFNNLPEEIRADIARQAEEAGDEAVRRAMDTGDLKGNKYYTTLKASTAYRTRNSLTNKYLKDLEKANEAPKEFASSQSTMTGDSNLNEEINRAGREAGKAAYDEAISNGLSVEQAKKAREIARDRARFAKRKELGGDAMSNRRNAAKVNQANIRLAFERLSPEMQEEIKRAAADARAKAKASVLDYGGNTKQANKKGSTAYHGYIESETRRILKELGFKNANDPRLANYERIGRNDTEHILKSGAGLSTAATPETVYGRALEEEAQELSRISGEDYSFIYDILTGRNNGDEDAMALYDMLMGK